jgi:hypothetical protein
LPGTVLVRLENRAPLITHLTDADGRSWILVASPLGVTDANNLCETGFFVPCLDRVTRFAAGSLRSGQEIWVAGFERRNPFYGTGKSASVFNEAGTFIDRWQSQTQVVFKQPGIYSIAPEGAPPYWVAVRSDPQESALEYSPPSPEYTANRNVMVLNEKELQEAFQGRSRLLSYLPWLLLALFLLAEVFLWGEPARLTRQPVK